MTRTGRWRGFEIFKLNKGTVGPPTMFDVLFCFVLFCFVLFCFVLYFREVLWSVV